MRPVVVTTRVSLASAPPDVWPLITDTDRTNRLLFGKAAVYQQIEKGTKSAARFVARTTLAGVPMYYEEAPFEWTLDKSFSVYRKMRGGVVRAYTFGMTLEPTSEGGTVVTVRLELEPRHWLMRPLLERQARGVVGDMTRIAAEIDAHLRDRTPSPFVRPISPHNAARLTHAARELAKRELDPEVVRVVLEVLRTGADADLVRIRPFELAEHHHLDPRETLRVLLHAVTAGVVELRWALVCPSCRTANDQVSSLSDLSDAGHCQLCDIRYGIELDRAVEATFRPHASVREVPDQMFCIGGPWRTPHVLVQANLETNATRDLEAPAQVGRYRVFGRGGAMASLEVEDGAPAAASATLENEAVTPGELHVAPGGMVRVHNASGGPLHVKIERLGYASLAATAHFVTTMSEFRRLFSNELLKPSTPLKVGHCAILFSDLTGSTALYTKAGDAAAFRLVDDHFDVLRKAIDVAGGAVVKTMGDAIMAAFLEPDACVAAAIACMRGFEAFRGSHPNGADTGLKLGLFAGPCYVVTANESIDYFGQTVNCAARVQHLAESGEIVLAEDVFDALPAALRAQLRVVENLEATVKGVALPLRLVRTRLASEDAASAGPPGQRNVA